MRQAASWLRRTLIGLVLVLFIGGCSSDEPEGDTATDSTAVSSTTTQVSTSDADDREPTDSPQLIELQEPDWTELQEWHLQALGGISFGVRPDYVVHHDNHMITIRPRYEEGRGRSLPTLVVSLVYNVFNAPLAGIDDFVQVSGWGSAEPNGQSLALFDTTLEGYTFVEDVDRGDEPVYMYSAYGCRYQASSAWQPFPMAELFLAEIPGAVVAVGYVGANESELAEAREIFETVAPTLELDNPLPEERPDPLDPILSVDYAPAPDPLVLAEAGPPILSQAFSAVAAGTYRSAHLGVPMTFTTEEGWWVQPNFPGSVILTGNDSFGPGDRGIIMEYAPTELTAATVGPIPVGELIDFTNFAALAESPPANLIVENYQATEVGGLAAEVIDVVVDPSATCQPDDPCQYLWPSVLPYPPQELRIGYYTRVWRIGGLNQPIMILAQAPDPSWLAVADDFVATVEFG